MRRLRALLRQTSPRYAPADSYENAVITLLCRGINPNATRRVVISSASRVDWQAKPRECAFRRFLLNFGDDFAPFCGRFLPLPFFWEINRLVFKFDHRCWSSLRKTVERVQQVNWTWVSLLQRWFEMIWSRLWQCWDDDSLCVLSNVHSSGLTSLVTF